MVGLAPGAMQRTRWPRSVATAIPGLHRSELTPLIFRQTAAVLPQPAARLWRLSPRNTLASETYARFQTPGQSAPRVDFSSPTMQPRTHTVQGVVWPVPCRQHPFPAQRGDHAHQDHGRQRKHHIRISLQAAATASYIGSGMPVGAVHWIKLRTMHEVHPLAPRSRLEPVQPPETSAPSGNQYGPAGSAAIMRCTFAAAVSISRVAIAESRNR